MSGKRKIMNEEQGKNVSSVPTVALEKHVVKPLTASFALATGRKAF